MSASLQALMPKKAEVLVGRDLVLFVETPTLAQQQDLFAFLAGLELSALWKTLGAFQANGLAALAERGQEIWAALVGELQHLATEDLGKIAATLVDCEPSFEAMTVDMGTPIREGSLYVRSSALRMHVAQRLTLQQAIYVIERAIDVGGYTEVGKALKRMLGGLVVAQEPTNDKPVATPEETQPILG